MQKESNSESAGKSKMRVIALKDLSGVVTFHNCTISNIETDYDISYLVWHDTDKLTFINKRTVLGKSITEYYSKLEPIIFNMTIESFGDGQYKGWNLKTLEKIGDRPAFLNDVELKGF